MPVQPMARTRHPWNTEFTWQPPAGPRTFLTEQQLDAYERDGCFVVEDAFDPATVARLDTELRGGDEKVKELLATIPGGRISVAGIDTQVVAPHAVTRSHYLREFCASPVLAGIAADICGPDVRLYWDQSVYKQPHSAEPVLFHQDNGYTYVEPQEYLTCWIAITDATPDNGCIAVMPGAHHDGTLAHRDTPIGQECWGDFGSARLVPVRAGSIVAFSSLTPHATVKNTTDSVRKAYIVQYIPDGAVALQGDPNSGPPIGRVVQDDPARQYLVVRGGMRVMPEPLAGG